MINEAKNDSMINKNKYNKWYEDDNKNSTNNNKR